MENHWFYLRIWMPNYTFALFYIPSNVQIHAKISDINVALTQHKMASLYAHIIISEKIVKFFERRWKIELFAN